MKEYEYTGKAMGTEFSISIICKSQSEANVQANISIKEIVHYENQFSRFSEQSELSKLNKIKEMVVSENFLEVMQEARRLFILTKGVFNPLFQIERLGYNKNFNDILPSDKKTEDTDNYDIDFYSTVIDIENSKIVLQKGQKLDFGGFLKGYLAEKICKSIKDSSKTIQGVIVNIGGDIYTQGLDENNKKFIFEIYNPITKQDDISISLYNQALATSGTYKRVWKILGEMYHHVLDSSGEKNPTNQIVSASIIHTSGSTAEAYAKVFLSLGENGANDALQDSPLNFILITQSGSIIKKTT
jgi:thiamine biosynthesis lipoprotein